MSFSIIIGGFHKKGSKIITYRNFKNFDNFSFREELQNKLDFVLPIDQNFKTFDQITRKILDKHAPWKTSI